MQEYIPDFFPELQQHTGDLYDVMTLVGYVLAFTGFVIAVYYSPVNPVGMIRSIIAVGLVSFAINGFPDWINTVQISAYELIDDLGADPSKSHARFAQLLGDEASNSHQDIGFWDILTNKNGGLADAIIYGAIFIVAKVAFFIMLLAFTLQQILILVQTALAPAFLGMLLIRPLSSLSSKFFLSLTAIALCPLGWAIADLFTASILDVVHEDTHALVEFARLGSVILLLTLWISISTIAAPFVIIKLLSQGSNAAGALLASVGGAISQGAVYGSGAGVTATIAGASPPMAAATGTAAAVGGAVSAATGSNGGLMAQAIGLGAMMSGGDSSEAEAPPAPKTPTDYNAKAAQLTKSSTQPKTLS